MQRGGNHIRCQRTDQRAEAHRTEVSSHTEASSQDHVFSTFTVMGRNLNIDMLPSLLQIPAAVPGANPVRAGGHSAV